MVRLHSQRTYYYSPILPSTEAQAPSFSDFLPNPFAFESRRRDRRSVSNNPSRSRRDSFSNFSTIAYANGRPPSVSRMRTSHTPREESYHEYMLRTDSRYASIYRKLESVTEHEHFVTMLQRGLGRQLGRADRERMEALRQFLVERVDKLKRELDEREQRDGSRR